MKRKNNVRVYRGAQLDYLAFPLGGIGAGMLCLDGNGAFSHVSMCNTPALQHEPLLFAALGFPGGRVPACVLAGPQPLHKVMGTVNNRTHGLRCCRRAQFAAQFPFGTVTLTEPALPLRVALTGWSPFIPNDADNSSLPVAALEYTFTNTTRARITAVFSFHAENFLSQHRAPRTDSVRPIAGGFVLEETGTAAAPWQRAAFSVSTDHPGAAADCSWFRGGWFDALTMLWRQIEGGTAVAHPPHTKGEAGAGASLYVPLTLAAGATTTVVVRLAWHAPVTNVRVAQCAAPDASAAPAHVPWYAGRFADIDAVTAYWRTQYDALRRATQQFSNCLHDTTLPAEVLDAVASNLAILKSPTVLRQTDGRFWAWEGSGCTTGCCHGSCTHVWNYAQALAHLFPALERSLRETEFNENQDARGHQTFRANLPISPVTDHTFHAAADGQLGGIMKVYRDWRISGDTAWLRALWPQVKQSLAFCIEQWDPRHEGVLKEPQHNTYDIEFWGANSLCTTIYLGALKAAALMARALGEDAAQYEALHATGRRYLETTLFNGEYFIQKVQWQNLRTPPPDGTTETWNVNYSPEALALLQQDGPKYQYGTGCLSDGVLGAWLARVCGVGSIADEGKVTRHLRAIVRHNFRRTLHDHTNPQRPQYARNDEGGLLVCSWPRGGAPALPLPYSNEVWTGIEYHVAAHCIMAGMVRDGLRIVRACRARYDGRVRNPFDELECGHWYARALSSYALLQACSGARYDAVEQTLYLDPPTRGDLRAFLCTATGFGTVGVRRGKPFCTVVAGAIPITRIVYRGVMQPGTQ